MVESEWQQHASQVQTDAGIVPAVHVAAPCSGELDFSWRLFYQLILNELGDDLQMPRTAFGIDSHNRLNKERISARSNLASLRIAVERGLRARQTKFLVIDEAAHIIRQTRPSRLEIQLDTLKSLANVCGTQIILVGSYDLYQLVKLSGQLARRTHVIHFERYREDRIDDLAAFRACLKSFQKMLPDLWGESLIPHTEALIQNTLGCIGTLSTVLIRAAKLALHDGKWTSDALRRALLTNAQRDTILNEIIDGEKEITEGLTRNMTKLVKRSSQVAGRSAA